MKWRRLIVLVVCALPLVAAAQTGVNTPSPHPYVPRLGDIMNAVQTRHMKLWFAGRSANWDLADYEIRQLRMSLAEAADGRPDSGAGQRDRGKRHAEIHQKLWRTHRQMQWLPSVDGTRLYHHARAGGFAFR